MSTDTREALDALDKYLEYLIGEAEKMDFIKEMRDHIADLRRYRAALATQPAPAEPQEQEGPALCWDCTSEQRVMGIVSRPAYICPRHRAAIAATKEQQA